MKDIKLKRYVLLDNNNLVDRVKLNNDRNWFIAGLLKAIENGEENLCRTVIATSDNVFDLVRPDDYIADSEGTLQRVLTVSTHGTIACLNWFFVKEEATAIYKWQDKNLICVWEREQIDE